MLFTLQSHLRFPLEHLPCARILHASKKSIEPSTQQCDKKIRTTAWLVCMRAPVMDLGCGLPATTPKPQPSFLCVTNSCGTFSLTALQCFGSRAWVTFKKSSPVSEFIELERRALLYIFNTSFQREFHSSLQM